MPQQALSPAAAATSGPACIAGPRKQSVQRGSRSAPGRLHLGQAARVLLLGCRQTLLQLAALAAGVLGQRPGGSGAGIVRQAAGAARQRNGMSSSQALRAATSSRPRYLGLQSLLRAGLLPPCSCPMLVLTSLLLAVLFAAALHLSSLTSVVTTPPCADSALMATIIIIIIIIVM